MKKTFLNGFLCGVAVTIGTKFICDVLCNNSNEHGESLRDEAYEEDDDDDWYDDLDEEFDDEEETDVSTEKEGEDANVNSSAKPSSVDLVSFGKENL